MNKSEIKSRLQRTRKVEPVAITGLFGAHVRMLSVGERERWEKLIQKRSDEGESTIFTLAFALCDSQGTPYVAEDEYDTFDGVDLDEAKAVIDVFLRLNKMRKEDVEESEKN